MLYLTGKQSGQGQKSDIEGGSAPDENVTSIRCLAEVCVSFAK